MTSHGDSVGLGRSEKGSARRRDLDLMRTFVVMGLFFFHSARVFDTTEWYVKNDQTREFVDVLLSFAATWGMPLLFVVSGMGIWYSLRSRTIGAFAGERVRRLLVPLVFGLLVIVPPQVWTWLRGNPAYDESYWDFLPRFFDIKLTFGSFPFVLGDDPATGLFEPGHLWFLVVLLAFSLLFLPVFWYLRQPAGQELVKRLAQHADHLWVIAAAGLPFGVLDAVFGNDVNLAGWSRYSYALFILYGYTMAADRRFGRAIHRHRKGVLLLAAATFVVVGALFAIGGDREGSDVMLDYDAVSVAMRVIRGVSGWLWVAAIMGFASVSTKPKLTANTANRKPTVLDRFSAYTSEAVLPIYVLHQTVIVLLGFYVVTWPINSGLRYVAIVLTSMVTAFVIYDVAVRRTRLTRFVFGMKPPARDEAQHAGEIDPA